METKIDSMWKDNDAIQNTDAFKVIQDRKLHNYSLTINQDGGFFLKELNHVINIRRRNEPPEKVLYATTERYVNSDLANQMLSLTYYPKFDSTVLILRNEEPDVLQVFDNRNVRIDLDLEDSSYLRSIPRVWPAFGKAGGSREVLIKNLKDDTDEFLLWLSVKRLPNGGAVEMWHQDAVYNYDIAIAQSIAAGVAEAFLGFEGQFNTEIDNIAKSTPTSITVNFFSEKMKRNVTLSVAWKNLNVQPAFKFWAFVCLDHEELSIRSLLEPFSETLVLTPFPPGESPEALIRQDLENRGPIYSSVKEIARSLISRTIGVDDGFYKYHCQKIKIP